MLMLNSISHTCSLCGYYDLFPIENQEANEQPNMYTEREQRNKLNVSWQTDQQTNKNNNKRREIQNDQQTNNICLFVCSPDCWSLGEAVAEWS